MGPRTVELRGYQSRATDEALAELRAGRDAIIESPTGSGKTQEIVVIGASLVLRGERSHVVVIAPQQQIEEGFLVPEGLRVAFPDGRAIAIARDVVRRARDAGRSVGEVARYLKDTEPRHVLACTYSAFRGAMDRPGGLPASFLGMLLVVDEAHHARARGLGGAIGVWAGRGGQQLYATATTFRGDGQEVVPEGMSWIRRSIAEHMESGYCPSVLRDAIVPFGRDGDVVTGAEFCGDVATPGEARQRLLARAIAGRLDASGRPKVMVRVPPLRGGSGPLIGAIAGECAALGLRVLDATGVGVDRKVAFLDALRAERGRSFSESKYDVLIGVQRVLEGTDWPHCSSVYCVGIPGSLQTVVQLLGRAQRDKRGIAGYPAAFRDLAEIVFFVPWGDSGTIGRLSVDHSRHTLLVASVLGDHRTSEEWIAERAVVAGLAHAGLDREADVVRELTRDREDQAVVRVVVAAIHREEPTLGPAAVAREAARRLPGVDRTIVEQVVARLVMSGSAGARDMATTKVREYTRIRPTISGAMQEAFRAVLEEFRDETLVDNPSLSGFCGQLHQFGPDAIRRFSEKLSAAIPWTEAVLSRAVRDHHRRNKKHPTPFTPGAIDLLGGASWMDVDSAIRNKSRGVDVGCGSLPEFVAMIFPPPAPGRSWTESLLISAVLDHHASSGGFPTRDTPGAIDKLGGAVWPEVDDALFGGSNGLSIRDSSLKDFVAKHAARRVEIPSAGRRMSP